jgi:hypothetical protein
VEPTRPARLNPAATRYLLLTSAHYPFCGGRAAEIRCRRPRSDSAAPRRLRLTIGSAAVAALSLVAGVTALPAGPAGATTTTTTTTATNGTTTTAAGHASSQADPWLLKAISAEAKIGSVRIDGKIQQNKGVIYLDLVVNADGEGGATFIQNGFNIELERVGTLLYFSAPKKYWQKTASPAQANAYGGKWLEISALDSRFVSFDQFLSADDLVFAAFEAHTTPLTMGKPIFVYKIVNDSPGTKSTLVFSHYGKAVSLTVPPNAINLT